MSRDLESEYLETLRHRGFDAEGRARMAGRLSRISLRVCGKPLRVSLVPRILTSGDCRALSSSAVTLHRICLKVMSAFSSDGSVRRAFGFDSRVLELMGGSCGESPLPFMRLDCMRDSGDGFRLCEINANAIGGMLEAEESSAAVSESSVYRDFASSHQVRAFGAASGLMADAFCGALGNGVGAHNVAIAVCFDSPNANVSEISHLASVLEARGFRCSVFDVRNIICKNGSVLGHSALYGGDMRVDCVLNYTIASDLLGHWDEIGGFRQAVRESAVPVVGSFLSQCVHDKRFMAVYRKEPLKSVLSDGEISFLDDFVPETHLLSDFGADPSSVIADKDRWVFKPCDLYAASGVAIGKSCDSDEWRRALKSRPSGEAVIQKLIETPPFVTVAVGGERAEGAVGAACRTIECSGVYGAFVFGGEFGGVYMREAPVGGSTMGLNTVCSPVVVV